MPSRIFLRGLVYLAYAGAGIWHEPDRPRCDLSLLCDDTNTPTTNARKRSDYTCLFQDCYHLTPTLHKAYVIAEDVQIVSTFSLGNFLPRQQPFDAPLAKRGTCREQFVIEQKPACPS